MEFSERLEKRADWNNRRGTAEWQALPATHRAAVEAEANHGPQSDDSSPSCYRMDSEDSDQDDEGSLACRQADVERSLLHI